jgi:DNA-binding MarR family transcriptional regulator
MRIRDKRPTRFDSPQQEAYLNRLRMLEDELFARHDLTAQQYNVLRLLRAKGPEPLPTLTLARRLVSRAPDITRMLDKLERHGWIVRQRPAENRRQVLVRITPAGIALLDRLEEPVRECHRRQLGHMSGTDLKRLTQLLRAAREPHEEPEGPWRG